MAGKTKTELQAENSNLKEELSNFKIDFKELSEKYENLQMQRNLDNKNRTTAFRCNNLIQVFQVFLNIRNTNMSIRLLMTDFNVINLKRNLMKNGR